MKKNITLFVVIQLLLCQLSVNTASAQWESNGPYGGRMMSAVSIGNDLFAGTFGGGPGIHKSTDNGESWTLIAGNMQSTQLFTEGTSLYAVSWHIIYRSDDAGATWSPISPDFGPAWASHSIDFAGNYLIYFNKNKVYRTATQNPSWADWEDVSGVFTSDNLIISSVAIQNNSIIVGVEYPNTINKGGFFRSVDFGSTWAQINNGYGLWFQGSLMTDRFPSVWALEYHEGAIYAGLRKFNGTPQGMWKSIDNGDNWTHIGFLNDSEPRTILSFSGNIFVGTTSNGIYKSTDGGNTWIPKNGALNLHQYFLVRRLFDGNDNSLIAVTDISILKSYDSGENWVVSQNGINELGTDAFGAIDEDIFMSSAQGGIFKSSDNGQSWYDINPGGPIALRNVEVMESILWLYSSDEFAYLSGDKGETWHVITPPSGNSFDSRIEHNQYLFVTVNSEGGIIARSADLGQTWEYLSVNNGAANPKGLRKFGDAIYVADWNTGHIWRSTDNGQTWATSGATGFPWGASVTGKDNFVFISNGSGAYSGIYRSDDYGQSFTFLDNIGSIEVYSDYIHQKWYNDVTNKWVTRRSFDYGDTWQIVTDKFFGGSQYYLIQANDLLYAASNQQVFQSADDGDTWIGIPSPPVSDAHTHMVHVVGSTIFQGTNASGIWLRNEPEATVNTLAAQELTSNSAILTGTVNPNESICSVTFEYGLTTSYGSVVQALPEIVNGTNPVYVTVGINGLEINTTYNFRTVASNAGGVYYGPNRSFILLPVSLSEISKSGDIDIYPNPTRNLLFIRGNEQVSRVKVTNLVGQVLIDIQTKGTQIIKLDELQNGIYLVTLYVNDKAQVVRKIIKQ
jgi:photosystem II stability/assembly factor-like uncharacterized protein